MDNQEIDTTNEQLESQAIAVDDLPIAESSEEQIKGGRPKVEIQMMKTPGVASPD